MLGTILSVKLNWATNSQVIIHQVILGLKKTIEGSPVPVVLELELTAESSGGLDETQMGFWLGGCGVHLRIAFLTGGVDAVGLETRSHPFSLFYWSSSLMDVSYNRLFWDISLHSNRSGTIAFKVTFSVLIIFFFSFLLVLATASSFIFSSVLLFGGLGVGRRA